MAIRISESGYQHLLKNQGKASFVVAAKKQKWNHIRCWEDGFTFDSESERERYRELLLLQRAGIIFDLRIHPVFVFVVNDRKIGKYTADFSYREKEKLIVEDVKNPANAKDRSYRRNIKLMWAHHGIEVQTIVKRR